MVTCKTRKPRDNLNYESCLGSLREIRLIPTSGSSRIGDTMTVCDGKLLRSRRRISEPNEMMPRVFDTGTPPSIPI